MRNAFDSFCKVMAESFTPVGGYFIPASELEDSTMWVFRVGTKVLIGGDVPGLITAIAIRDRTTYEVVWWDNRTRKSEWLEEYEITPQTTPGSMDRIGFK